MSRAHSFRSARSRSLLVFGALLALLLLAATPARAAKGRPSLPPVAVAIVEAPPTPATLGSIGTPVAITLDVQDAVPPPFTDSDFFEVPAGKVLIIDWVTVTVQLDRTPSPDTAGQLFVSVPGARLHVGVAQQFGRDLHFGGPVSIVARPGFVNFFTQLDSLAATPLFARYSFTGRLVDAP